MTVKTVVLLNINFNFVESVIYFFQESCINKKYREQHLFEIEMFIYNITILFWNITHVYT